MAREVRKPVIACLRTHDILFTLLFAMSETRALHPSLLGVPQDFQADFVRVLWKVSYQMLSVMSTRRYLSPHRATRYKCADWYTNALPHATDDQYHY